MIDSEARGLVVLLPAGPDTGGSPPLQAPLLGVGISKGRGELLDDPVDGLPPTRLVWRIVSIFWLSAEPKRRSADEDVGSEATNGCVPCAETLRSASDGHQS